MAYFKFTQAILEGRPIDVFNRGQMKRDFTYHRRHRRGRGRVLARGAPGQPGWDAVAPTRAAAPRPTRCSIGNNRPEELLHFIAVLEEALGKQAERTCSRCSRATCRDVRRRGRPDARHRLPPRHPD